MRVWFPTGEPIGGHGSCVPDLTLHWPFRVGAGPTLCRTVPYGEKGPEPGSWLSSEEADKEGHISKSTWKCRIPRSLLVVLVRMCGAQEGAVSVGRDGTAEWGSAHRGGPWCPAQGAEPFPTVGGNWKFDENVFWSKNPILYFFETWNVILFWWR